jgi:hypothetical protein
MNGKVQIVLKFEEAVNALLQRIFKILKKIPY